MKTLKMKKMNVGMIMITILIMVISCTTSAYAAGNPYYTWKAEKRSKPFEEKGGWIEVTRAYTNGKSTATIACNTTASVSSTYTGELKIGIPALESYALMQHKINKSFKKSVKYSDTLKGKKKGTYAIFYRKVYNCRNVTQRKYMRLDGTTYKTSETKVVKAKDFKSISYKIKKISDKDIS